GEFQMANNGVLPVTANGALTAFIGYLEGARVYARGERVLLEQLKHPAHAEQRRWLNDRLDELYHQALQHDGDVSLGKGAALYQALTAKLQKNLADSDPNRRHQSIVLLCDVYRTAQTKKLPGVGADVK